MENLEFVQNIINYEFSVCSDFKTIFDVGKNGSFNIKEVITHVKSCERCTKVFDNFINYAKDNFTPTTVFNIMTYLNNNKRGKQ